MAYSELVEGILSGVGGKENINSVTHCVTRLRFNLKNDTQADAEKIKKLPEVVTVIQSGGQFQVVIGNHVPEVYSELIEVSGLSKGVESDVNAGEKKKKGLDALIDIISSIFTPVLGLLAATGMIKGLNILFVALGLISKDSGTFAILQAAGDCFFYFFPIFLGYTSAKKFGLKPFIGMALGAALVYPALSGLTANAEPLYVLFSGTIFESPVYITFLGVPVILMNYSSSVIPIIIATFFGAKVEKGITKLSPRLLRTFLVPFFTVLIMVPLTFLIIGPVATWIGKILGVLVLTIYNFNPILAGIFIGGTWQILVMFGLHWGVLPIGINNLTVLGYDPVLVLGMATPFATAGAVLAVVIKSRNRSVKAIGIPAFISSLFGVSEPSLYGITLPRKKPFIATLIASAIGGAIIGFSGTKAYIMGGMGIFGIPNYINPEAGLDRGFYGILVALLVAFILGFVLTITLFYDKEHDEESQHSLQENNKKEHLSKELLESVFIDIPIEGEVIPLSKVKDEAFSKEILGKGVAVIPSKGQLFSPFDGVVKTLFPTGHAIGLVSDSKIELLIHIGTDTVKLDGKYFYPKVKQGDRVEKGDLLLEFDIEKIREAGYSIETPIVVTNSRDYLDVLLDNSDTAEWSQLRIII